jgi:flagellar FliJ protein
VGYAFKLEALRRYRQFQEDELQRALAAAMGRKEEALAVVAAYQARLDQAATDLYLLQRNPTEVFQLEIYQRFMRRIDDEIADQNRNVEEIEVECRDIRGQLMEAMQKRKTLERLKEKELSAYMEELSREEQKFINEIAVNRFNLKGIQ